MKDLLSRVLPRDRICICLEKIFCLCRDLRILKKELEGLLDVEEVGLEAAIEEVSAGLGEDLEAVNEETSEAIAEEEIEAHLEVVIES